MLIAVAASRHPAFPFDPLRLAHSGDPRGKGFLLGPAALALFTFAKP